MDYDSSGLVKREGFAVDASVLVANARRYHGKTRQEFRADGRSADGVFGATLRALV